MNPNTYRPMWPAEFIGPAGTIAKVLDDKAAAAKRGGTGPIKLLLYGPPGSGKSALAAMLTKRLCQVTQTVNGRSINPLHVQQWISDARYKPMGWVGTIIEEADTARQDSQDLLLTFLDSIGEGHAVIATSNLDISSLTPRFQTRFQQLKVSAPTSDDVATLLQRTFKVPKALSQRIAVGCGGNVRAALLDAQSALDTGMYSVKGKEKA